MSRTTQSTLRAGTAAIAPAILLAALSSHPYLPGQQPNVEALASEVAANPTRWGLVHVVTGVASGLLILAFLSVRSYLQMAGEDRWSALGLPFVIIGSTLYAMLPAMEFAPLAAVETGGSAQAAQAALLPWFAPLLVIGALSFGVGVLAFALGIARSKVLSPGGTRLASVALVVMAASRFVPWSAIQFYVQGAAGVIALLPLAAEMWRRPEPRPANPSAARERSSPDAASAGR